jgi:hypothetical protein
MKAWLFAGAGLAAGLLAPTALPATEAAPAAAPKTSGRIAWFGTWDAALAEAKRSSRPILLIAAAPHCHNISGMW